MAADKISDPNFINLGIQDARYRNEEWFSLGEVRVRAPRYAAQSALIIVGASHEKISAHLDNASGWVLILPEGYFETVDLSTTPSSQAISDFYSLLKRLGVQESFVTFIVLQGSWHLATALADSIQTAHLIYCAHDAKKLANDDGSRSFHQAIQHTENNPVRFTLTSFLVPEEALEQLPPARQQRVLAGAFASFAHDGVPSAHFWHVCASLDSVVLGGGSPLQYLHQQFIGSKFAPYAGFLESISETLHITHISGCRFTIVDNELRVGGYNLTQSRPARSWGSYSHKLVMKTEATGEIVEHKLGSLKREILDSLPFTSNGTTNAYGAFALPKNQGIDLSALAEGTYRLHIEDGTGYKIINKKHTELYTDDLAKQRYSLAVDEQYVTLTVGE